MHVLSLKLQCIIDDGHTMITLLNVLCRLRTCFHLAVKSLIKYKYKLQWSLVCYCPQPEEFGFINLGLSLAQNIY